MREMEIHKMAKQEVKRVNEYIKIQLFIIYMVRVSVCTISIACPIMDFILLVDCIFDSLPLLALMDFYHT